MKEIILYVLIFFLLNFSVSLSAIELPIEYNVTGPTCQENWICPDWNTVPCVNDTKTITCTDLNNCGTQINGSTTQNQSCQSSTQSAGGGGTTTQPSTSEIPSVSSLVTSYWYFIVGLIVVFVIFWLKRRKSER